MGDGVVEEQAVRPELVNLAPADRERVLQLIAAKGGQCEGCGGTDFTVGDALYLGFLFLDEDTDAYMVALTCRRPDCVKPRTGIVLPENDIFLTRHDEARAASWRIALPDGA